MRWLISLEKVFGKALFVWLGMPRHSSTGSAGQSRARGKRTGSDSLLLCGRIHNGVLGSLSSMNLLFNRCGSLRRCHQFVFYPVLQVDTDKFCRVSDEIITRSCTCRCEPQSNTWTAQSFPGNAERKHVSFRGRLARRPFSQVWLVRQTPNPCDERIIIYL